MNLCHKAGFTLAELLVVVIILAVLTGVAAGTYRKAIEQSHMREGLAMATAVQESRDRNIVKSQLELLETYNLDPGAMHGGFDKFEHLDTWFKNAKTCGPYNVKELGEQQFQSVTCIETKYFKVHVYMDGPVHSQMRLRNIYTEAERKTGDYSIYVYSQELGTSAGRNPDCKYNNDKGQDLCISAGYLSCVPDGEGGLCSKP